MNASKRTGIIQLSNGAGFRPKDTPHPPYDIEVTASSLARICRFSGHLKDGIDIYSVAQHCVLGSYQIAKGHALAFLLHDAPEAYTGYGDVVGTVKGRWLIDQETRLLGEMATQYDLQWPMPKCIEIVDARMLATEKRDLMETVSWWTVPAEPFKYTIEPWSVESSKEIYLLRFKELTEQ